MEIPEATPEQWEALRNQQALVVKTKYPVKVRKPYDVEKAKARFISKIRVEDNGCYTWMPFIGDSGYGMFHYDGRSIMAHRAAWFFHYGEWPPPWPASGMVVNHTCHNRACVNPYHLELLPYEENLRLQRQGRDTRASQPKQTQHCECCSKYVYNKDTHTYEEKFSRKEN